MHIGLKESLSNTALSAKTMLKVHSYYRQKDFLFTSQEQKGMVPVTKPDPMKW